MECLTSGGSSTRPVLISNAKVLEMLQKNVKGNKKRLVNLQEAMEKLHGKKTVVRNRFKHRDWIEEKVVQYLKKTPCVNLPVRKTPELKRKCMGSKHGGMQRPRKVAVDNNSTANNDDNTTASESISYGLTEAETLQILNFMPEEPVEIHLMVEELHARMSETQQEEFLEMIKSYSTKGKKVHGKNKRKRSDSHDASGGGGATSRKKEASKEKEESRQEANNPKKEDEDDVFDVLNNNDDDNIVVKEEDITI